LATFLVCGVIFSLGWLGIRSFVEQRLSHDDTNSTRVQLDQLVLAYKHGLPGGDQAAGLSGDAMYVVLGGSGQVVATSDAIVRLRPQWTLPAPAPAGAPANWETTVDASVVAGVPHV
jgi:hypothetical protein